MCLVIVSFQYQQNISRERGPEPQRKNKGKTAQEKDCSFEVETEGGDTYFQEWGQGTGWTHS